MRPEETIAKTPLGFLDVTKVLGPSFVIQKYHVIRNVLIKKINLNRITYGPKKGTEAEVGEFSIPEARIKGRIFPMDELIQEGETYDLIVQSIKRNQLDTHVYHDFYKTEQIPVQISGYGRETGEPSFKLFNWITGFIKNKSPTIQKEIEIGDAVLIAVEELFKMDKRFMIHVKALELLV
ncbi:hypothetical protein A3K73_06595 [Candidatus Pacearchaeota archaeon RBG_13_36_9]|nr:MAG: hypothetical protein A3K73_06595 [Candidatus Pacearchaeota archaeon RBG_13_36_9]